MPNEAACSNQFQVRDADALRAELHSIGPIELYIPDTAHPNLVAVFCEEAWPTSRHDERSGENLEVSIAQVIARHLDDGHVAVLTEVGYERSRVSANRAMPQRIITNPRIVQ